MNIIIGKTSGFCGGVRNSISKAEEELRKSNVKIDCLGELIHNKQVIQDLENKGLRIINSINDASNKVIIRAHGVSKDVYEVAEKKGIELIDLTCPKVLKIHKQVQDFSNNNFFIFLLGMKEHPETIGTFSFCGKNSYIIETENDLDDAINACRLSGLKDILVISQTTFSLKLFNVICDSILDILGKTHNVNIENSICNATSTRQDETEQMAQEVDLMIIIGGKNSSNTKKLYEISLEKCAHAIHIETKSELDLNFVRKFENIGIMAGASTPEYIVNDVYNAIIQL